MKMLGGFAFSEQFRDFILCEIPCPLVIELKYEGLSLLKGISFHHVPFNCFAENMTEGCQFTVDAGISPQTFMSCELLHQVVTVHLDVYVSDIG